MKLRNKTRYVLWSCILLALSWVSQINAATYFVDQRNFAANDNNAGINENLPWLTLTKATNTVDAGDTVIVKEGNYIDSSAGPNSMRSFQLRRSGTASSPIVFRSEPRGAAIIGRHTSSGPAWGIESREYIVLDGFKGLGAIGFRDGNHNVIKNCEVVNGSIIWGDISLHWGIYLQNSNNGLIENNYVHDMDNSGNSSHNTACVMLFGACFDSIIQNNTVDGNNKKVYNAYGTKAGGMDRSVWRYNMASNCTTGFMGMGSTDGGVSVYDLSIYQNIIINCTWGIELYKNSDRTEFYNNTLNGVERVVTVEDATCNDFQIWNNITNSSSYGLVRFSGYNDSNAFSDLFKYSDYNNYLGGYGQFAYREENTLSYSTMSAWKESEGFDSNSLVVTPDFINAGGMNPTDYKRTTYTIDGRGGDYHSIMGAYVTGLEKIGYDFESNRPNVPIGFKSD